MAHALNTDTAAALADLPAGPAIDPVTNTCAALAAQQSQGAAAKGLSEAQMAALRAVAPATPPPIPCKFLGATVTDPQGRKPGPDGTLYVVPEVAYKVKVGKADEGGAALSRGISAASETITAVGRFEGGCGPHPAWETTTAQGSRQQPGTCASLEVAIIRPPKLLLPYAFEFTVGRLQAQACEGNATEYTVHAVAGDEVEFEFQTDAIKTPLTNVFTRTFNLKEGKVETKKKAEIAGKLKLTQAWKEVKKEVEKSHRAYCETTFEVAADPLFKVAIKGLAYGLPIPPSLSDLLTLGLFWNVEASGKLKSDLVLWRWADTLAWEAHSGGLTGEIKVEGGLSAELTLLDPEICGVEVSGKTGLTGSFGLQSEAHGLRAEGKWNGFTAAAKVSMFDGWVEVEKEWNCFDHIEPLQHDWPIETLFGPAPAAAD